jgi:L-iditol 2-dehydrogenase
VRVAVYHSNADVRVEERPRPRIAAGELLLRIKASGICGSDVMEWYRRAAAPVVLGHEIAGTVEEAGAGDHGFRPGDRVVATHHVPCNRCRYCLSDRHSVCETLRRSRFDPGGFAEFVRLPAAHVERGTFRLPDPVSFEAGSFVEPLACVVRGQRQAGVRPGDSVAVLGAGLAGLLHVRLARALGAGRILATDLSPYRLGAAAESGADRALRAEPGVVERLLQANDGRRVDRVLVCTAAREALEQALELVDRGGSVLVFAPLPPGETLALPLSRLWADGISIVHSYAGPPSDMRTALELIAAGRIDVAALVTHRLGLGEIQEGFRLTAAAGASLKVVIDPER